MRTLCNFTVSSFLILFLVVTEVWFLADSKTYWGDVEVLKQLKNGLDPNSVSPGSCLSSWDFAVDPCDSLFSDRFTCGFSCDVTVAGVSRVTEISLDQAGYASPLSSPSSSVTWDLPYLETLDLSNNYFRGSLPSSLSNLTRLTRLVLSGNSFSGDIPASIGSLSNLEELFLDGNGLEGRVPASFGGLRSLKRLELQGNKLSGQFPDLSLAKNLYILDASDNYISGGVPAKFPASMVQISMRNNRLVGTVPGGIAKLGFLQVMDLSHNNLSGAVPSVLFTHPSLQQLTLSFNRFSSVQAPAAGGASGARKSELIAVDMSDNRFRGLLPAFMAAMPKLSALSLENNRFSGMVPMQYAFKAAVPGAGVLPLARLLLGGNYLFGPVPSPLMKLKPSQATLSLADNCLYSCPPTLFFCRGARQKPLRVCKNFGPVVPRSL